MTRLPVIVGFGGFNAAGRSSFYQGFRRMVFENLPAAEQVETLCGLATMMRLVRHESGNYIDDQGNGFSAEQLAHEYRQHILDETLVRYWENPHPPEYTDAFYEKIAVKSAGLLPTGFDPGSYYRSQFHPKGLKMAVMAASDAVKSMGIPWATVMGQVAPDEVAVYSSSGMSQLDDDSNRALMVSRMQGKRITAKQLALGLNTMPTDFINAYVLGSVGATGSITGACASFLYTLRQGVEDIQSGRRRVAIVGNSEAPVTQEIADGYAAMGALATVVNLQKLDGTETADFRRASRPFSDNCGFTLGESAQYFVLMDDALALQLGATVYGAVTDVFSNADGNKRSISSPGAGNYITVSKAVARAKAILGEDALRHRSYIQSHGSSTPQNRVTESAIYDRVARAFGISEWPIAAVKSYVAHSLAPASGDQLAATLGSFAYDLIPGIKTIDHVADDVYQERLSISNQDREASMDMAFVNSKGFGGNNATALVLAPNVVTAMMAKRHGQQAFSDYRMRNESVQEAASSYNQAALQGDLAPIYQFGESVVNEEDIAISDKSMKMPGFSHEISLELPNPYDDMV
ncbi:MAG: beta-ketoacyl synthase [Pseudomonadales bacterium]|nr:beta-ketoacyl synthase [Pseudomonadales bacterium]